MRIIPAIDIIGGKCVRLSKGDYSTVKVYNESPLKVARQFEDIGIQHLHLVDLDGAKTGKVTNHNVLQAICEKTKLIVDYGGGIRSDEDIEIAFNSGAFQVTAGSIALNNPALMQSWINRYGSRIILGADCLKRKIKVSGWLEQSETDVIDFIQHHESNGITQVICTDIDKDGMLKGPAIELYSKILKHTSVKLIASGGISSLDDLQRLSDIGCDGAIIGKALYEGSVPLDKLKSYA